MTDGPLPAVVAQGPRPPARPLLLGIGTLAVLLTGVVGLLVARSSPALDERWMTLALGLRGEPWSTLARGLDWLGGHVVGIFVVPLAVTALLYRFRGRWAAAFFLVASVASALVVVPATGAGQWPVVNVAHGTTGVASPCAPSLAVEPFEAGAFFVLDQVIDQGWAVVQPDYLGLGTEGPHPYLLGDASARAVLDASRAARELAPARLGAQNVVWGHSQGGGAALWTGGIAAGYAPDLSIVGVAALAPASDLPGLVESLPTVTGGSVFASYVLSAYSAVYPDVDFAGYVRPAARVVVREMAGRCLAEPGVVVSVLNALALSRDPLVFAADPGDGTLGARLAQNVPTLPVAAPLLVAQGEADSLITPDAQDGYIAGRCAAGQRLDYRRYPGRDHVGLVEPDSPLIPDLLEWTRDRFAGESVADGCNVPQR